MPNERGKFLCVPNLSLLRTNFHDGTSMYRESAVNLLVSLGSFYHRRSLYGSQCSSHSRRLRLGPHDDGCLGYQMPTPGSGLVVYFFQKNNSLRCIHLLNMVMFSKYLQPIRSQQLVKRVSSTATYINLTQITIQQSILQARTVDWVLEISLHFSIPIQGDRYDLCRFKQLSQRICNER